MGKGKVSAKKLNENHPGQMSNPSSQNLNGSHLIYTINDSQIKAWRYFQFSIESGFGGVFSHKGNLGRTVLFNEIVVRMEIMQCTK